MRYFLITVSQPSTVETVTFEQEKFPTHAQIIEAANSSNCAIQCLFEFKSKEDYESFTSKS